MVSAMLEIHFDVILQKYPGDFILTSRLLFSAGAFLARPIAISETLFAYFKAYLPLLLAMDQKFWSQYGCCSGTDNC